MVAGLEECSRILLRKSGKRGTYAAVWPTTILIVYFHVIEAHVCENNTLRYEIYQWEDHFRLYAGNVLGDRVRPTTSDDNGAGTSRPQPRYTPNVPLPTQSAFESLFSNSGDIIISSIADPSSNRNKFRRAVVPRIVDVSIHVGKGVDLDVIHSFAHDGVDVIGTDHPTQPRGFHKRLSKIAGSIGNRLVGAPESSGGFHVVGREILRGFLGIDSGQGQRKAF